MRRVARDDLLIGADGIADAVFAKMDVAPPSRAAVGAAIDPRAVALFLRGVERRERYDFVGARTAFEAALRLSPGFALAEMALARTLEGLGYERLAISHYRRLADAMPGVPQEVRLAARCRAEAAANNWEIAVPLLDRLVRVSALSEAGKDYFPQLDEALADLQTLVPPTEIFCSRMLLTRGRALAFRGHLEESRQIALEAMRLAAASGEYGVGADAHALLGMIVENQGRLDDAVRELRIAQALYGRRGFLLFQQAMRLDELRMRDAIAGGPARH